METKFQELFSLVKTLREKCPWDKEQTVETAKDYVMEEAYELVDAVIRENHESICEEMGDLLFQVLFLANIEEEGGECNLKVALERVKEKMIRRHPHVFSGTEVKDSQGVVENWKRIKEKEKSSDGPELLRSLPGSIRLKQALGMAKRANIRLPEISLLANSILERLQLSIFEETTPEQQQRSMAQALVLTFTVLFLLNKDPEEVLYAASENILRLVKEGAQEALVEDVCRFI